MPAGHDFAGATLTASRESNLVPDIHFRVAVDGSKPSRRNAHRHHPNVTQQAVHEFVASGPTPAIDVRTTTSGRGQAILGSHPGRLTLRTLLAEMKGRCMTLMLGVDSEVGLLREAIVHRPGLELTRVTPSNRDEMRATTGRGETKFLHCLPSLHNSDTDLGRRLHDQFGLDGAEVSNDVCESPASIVFDQAENRLHTIKAVMVNALGSTG